MAEKHGAHKARMEMTQRMGAIALSHGLPNRKPTAQDRAIMQRRIAEQVKRQYQQDTED